jgi:hypothetical protein
VGTSTWTNIIALASLKGADGYTPQKGVDYNDGADGNDGLSLNPRGEYDAGVTYMKDDIVSYNGSSFIVLLDNTTGITPVVGTNYMLNASKGESGS